MIELDEVVELIQMIVDSEADITEAMGVDSIPGWDSVNALRLFSQLEKETGQKLSMKLFLETRTVADIVNFIQAG
ncbi:acyl carrier protein [Teredinibacter purpureus]|jgi:Phosphopantetheine attachment site.|uniref:acyl carrier protein n=1 Tax=Teredinibacter purpureus TaxID=2731756 RepID=UPI0005F808FC|nr:acyl carrier protein [Teredinibacter purpureus]